MEHASANLGNNDTEVGRNVEHYRKSLGMTQAQLAKALSASGFKCTQQMLARIESGSRPIRLTEAPAFTAVLHVGIPELLMQDPTVTRLGEVAAALDGVQRARADLRNAAETYASTIQEAFGLIHTEVQNGTSQDDPHFRLLDNLVWDTICDPRRDVGRWIGLYLSDGQATDQASANTYLTRFLRTVVDTAGALGAGPGREYESGENDDESAS